MVDGEWYLVAATASACSRLVIAFVEEIDEERDGA